MTAILGLLAEFGPERIGVGLLPFVDSGPPFAAGLPFYIYARRIVLERALGALYAIVPGVRPRIGYVVLEHDGLALRRLEDRRVVIARDVLLGPPRIGFIELRFAPELETAVRSADGYEVLIAIAGVHVEIPRDRPEAMCWIEVGVGAGVPRAAPETFVARLEEDGAQVVEVGRFGVEHFAEDAVVHHAIHEHLGLAVVAVLEVQAMTACFLRRIDER